MKLFVYAIVDSVKVPPQFPDGGARLRIVSVGRIAAVVDRRRRAPAPTPRNVRQYHRTVAAIAAAVPAILPARFGTLVGEEELSFILRARATSLRAALTRLRGRVQMTARILSRGGEARAAGALQGTPDSDAGVTKRGRPSGVGPGAAYLRRRVSPDGEIQQLLAPLRRAVQRWVQEEEVTRRGGIVNVYHLVRRRSVAAYQRALLGAAHEGALAIIVSGPLPPYAFAATM